MCTQLWSFLGSEGYRESNFHQNLNNKQQENLGSLAGTQKTSDFIYTFNSCRTIKEAMTALSEKKEGLKGKLQQLEEQLKLLDENLEVLTLSNDQINGREVIMKEKQGIEKLIELLSSNEKTFSKLQKTLRGNTHNAENLLNQTLEKKQLAEAQRKIDEQYHGQYLKYLRGLSKPVVCF